MGFFDDAKKIRAELDAEPPTHFIPDKEGSTAGMGYWRVKGGIMCYRRTKDGIWDIFSQQVYPETTIELLNHLLEHNPIDA